MNVDEEIVLLKQLAQGNEKSFETLYYAYRIKVFGGILKLVKSSDFAQDILQDVFVKVWQNRSKINPDKSFKSYLYAITQSAVYDFFRKLASDKTKTDQLIALSVNHYFNDIEEELSYKDMEKHLRDILDIMPERCREVYVLCKLEGRSYDEVAQLLNISTATINNHIVKASRIIKSNWNWSYYGAMVLFFTMIEY